MTTEPTTTQAKNIHIHVGYHKEHFLRSLKDLSRELTSGQPAAYFALFMLAEGEETSLAAAAASGEVLVAH